MGISSMDQADAAVLLQRHARGRVVRHTLQLHAEVQAEFDSLEAVQRAKALLKRYFDRELNTAASRLQRQWRKRRSRKRPARMRAATLITQGTADAAAFAATSGRGRAVSSGRSPGAMFGLEVKSRRKNSMEVAIEELAAQRRQAVLERSSRQHSGRQRAMTHSAGSQPMASRMVSRESNDTSNATRKRSASVSVSVDLGEVKSIAAPAEVEEKAVSCAAAPAATPAAAPAAAPAVPAAAPAAAPAPGAMPSMSSSLSSRQVVPGSADRGIGDLALVGGGGIHGAIPEDAPQRAAARGTGVGESSAEAEMKLELTGTLLKRNQRGAFQPRVFSLSSSGEADQRQVELAYASNKGSRGVVRLGRATNARATDDVKREFSVSLDKGVELRLRAKTISQRDDWMRRFPSLPESVPQLDTASPAKPVRRTWLGRAPAKVRAASRRPHPLPISVAPSDFPLTFL